MLHGRALRYIDEVARAGSIRKAARTLNVAASAVNRHIIELEQDLDAPIFERLPRGLRLTSSGELLIAHIRETLRNHDRMRAQIQSLKGLTRGEVTIATMATLGSGRLAEITALFREAHPLIRLRVIVGDREALVEKVAAGEADLGLGYNLPADPRLRRAWEVQHRIGAVIAPDHPLTARKMVRVTDCLAYPLVLADRGLSLREVVEKLMPANTELSPAVETNSTEMMKRLAGRAPHVTFLNRVDVDQELRDGDLAFLPLMGAAGRQRLLLVERARGTLSPAASRFAQLLEAEILGEQTRAEIRADARADPER
jgi:DNA-binding transcriptional LysR family regulator